MTEAGQDGAGGAARLAAMRPAIEARSRLLAAVRAFFLARDFVEVETPVRLAAPALELHIDAEPAGGWFLRTSPELHMKRLLAAGYPRLFQVGPCFRRGERGDLHHPEYTMLEWYRAGADYMDMLADMRQLLADAARAVTGGAGWRHEGRRIDAAAPWAVLGVAEAFLAHAGWNPVDAWDADRFDLDLVTKVEPALPAGRPCVLKDYPIEACALARAGLRNPRIAERWELYLGGVEIANAFSELTDAGEQRRRFEAWARARAAAGREVYPLDESFLAALETGMPAAGGVALGIDRLLMVLCGARTLDAVMPFREPPV